MSHSVRVLCALSGKNGPFSIQILHWTSCTPTSLSLAGALLHMRSNNSLSYWPSDFGSHVHCLSAFLPEKIEIMLTFSSATNPRWLVKQLWAKNKYQPKQVKNGGPWRTGALKSLGIIMMISLIFLCPSFLNWCFEEKEVMRTYPFYLFEHSYSINTVLEVPAKTL